MAGYEPSYALLPYWYTVFCEASVTGFPVMRAMWLEFPFDSASFALDDQVSFARFVS